VPSATLPNWTSQNNNVVQLISVQLAHFLQRRERLSVHITAPAAKLCGASQLGLWDEITNVNDLSESPFTCWFIRLSSSVGSHAPAWKNSLLGECPTIGIALQRKCILESEVLWRLSVVRQNRFSNALPCSLPWVSTQCREGGVTISFFAAKRMTFVSLASTYERSRGLARQFCKKAAGASDSSTKSVRRLWSTWVETLLGQKMSTKTSPECRLVRTFRPCCSGGRI